MENRISNAVPEQFKNFHIVFAKVLVRLACLADIWDEILPCGLPFIFENLFIFIYFYLYLNNNDIDLIEK